VAGGGSEGAGRLLAILADRLGYITGHGQEHVSDPCLLRVSRRAWEDLGVDPPDEALAGVVEAHAILKKFYDTYSSVHAVDRGTPLSQAEDPKVFRIRREEWRAAVRYEPEDGIVWLCRAVSLAKFHREDDAYDRLGELERNGRLLPTPDERAEGRAAQFLVAALQALRVARVRADQNPREWHEAHADRPDGSEHRAGRVWVEYDDIDDEATITTRYMLTVTEPPSDVTMPSGWLEFLVAHVLPSDEPVQRAYTDLPAGTNLQSNELPLIQESMETHDEEDEDGLLAS